MIGQRDAQRFIKVFWVIWAVWGVVCLAAFVGIAWAIIHFVSKYW